MKGLLAAEQNQVSAIPRHVQRPAGTIAGPGVSSGLSPTPVLCMTSPGGKKDLPQDTLLSWHWQSLWLVFPGFPRLATMIHKAP